MNKIEIFGATLEIGAAWEAEWEVKEFNRFREGVGEMLIVDWAGLGELSYPYSGKISFSQISDWIADKIGKKENEHRLETIINGSKIDEEWTNWRNSGTDRHYVGFRFTDAILETIYAEIDVAIEKLQVAIVNENRAKAAEKAAKEAKNAALLASVKSFDAELEGYDRLGDIESPIYKCTIVMHDGETLVFDDRNIPDFGRVINPMYDLGNGKKGGLRVGDKWTQTNGYERGLTENEKIAMDVVWELGKHANSAFLM
ncbi:MAG: hypothetical protein LBQ52_05420 [Helicobacteraceae bacterium]|jgi:hypothetical protein|nr:hypothetical protein [Helicobacteraceae bacterium]